MFTADQYETLHKFAFSPDNPGYKPAVVESPDGDGVWDEDKKFAHIAPKYTEITEPSEGLSFALKLYEEGLKESRRVCDEIGLSKDFYPGYDSTLRILDYPPGSTTAPHYDFDLFTLCLYRDQVEAFKYLDHEDEPLLEEARRVSPGIHFGELLEQAVGAKPTRHEVVATEKRQASIVFFVIPPHETKLPSGMTVGDWIEERKGRARKTKGF